MKYDSINSQTILDDDPARQELMISFFRAVNDFMSARHNYKRSKCKPFINKIDARCSKFSLTLSYLHDNSAGITAIRFKETRRGHCSALVDFIDNVSIAYRIHNIEFISVQTDKMKGFVIKNRFINREPWFSPVENDFVESGNWYRPTPFGLARK